MVWTELIHSRTLTDMSTWLQAGMSNLPNLIRCTSRWLNLYQSTHHKDNVPLTSGSRVVNSLIGLPLKLMCSSSGQPTSASRPLAILLSLKSNCNTVPHSNITQTIFEQTCSYLPSIDSIWQNTAAWLQRHTSVNDCGGYECELGDLLIMSSNEHTIAWKARSHHSNKNLHFHMHKQMSSIGVTDRNNVISGNFTTLILNDLDSRNSPRIREIHCPVSRKNWVSSLATCWHP